MFLTFAALLAGMQTAAEPAKVMLVGTFCDAQVDGRAMSWDELEAQARTWAADKREVEVVPPAGQTCYQRPVAMLREAGVARVWLHGRLVKPPVVLTTNLNCALMLDGKPVTVAQIDAMAPRWAAEETQIVFQINDTLDRPCYEPVDKILARYGANNWAMSIAPSVHFGAKP